MLRALEASRLGLTVPELHDAIEADCDQRTLYRDIEALEQAGFPLHKDEESKRWRLLEPREGGWVVPLAPTELIALALSESLFAHAQAAQILELDVIPEDVTCHFARMPNSRSSYSAGER